MEGKGREGHTSHHHRSRREAENSGNHWDPKQRVSRARDKAKEVLQQRRKERQEVVNTAREMEEEKRVVQMTGLRK